MALYLIPVDADPAGGIYVDSVVQTTAVVAQARPQFSYTANDSRRVSSQILFMYKNPNMAAFIPYVVTQNVTPSDGGPIVVNGVQWFIRSYTAVGSAGLVSVNI